MLISCDSHKNVREMEHELFRSKLKSLVDRTLIPSIIEGSSSGEHPHHAVAVWLVLERSTQERRERMSRIKNASQLDSQAERNTEVPTIAIQQDNTLPLHPHHSHCLVPISHRPRQIPKHHQTQPSQSPERWNPSRNPQRILRPTHLAITL